jgi:hypothetical protein
VTDAALTSPGAAIAARAAVERALAPDVNAAVREFLRRLSIMLGLPLALTASAEAEALSAEEERRLLAAIQKAENVGQIVDLWQAVMDPVSGAVAEIVPYFIRESFKDKVKGAIRASDAPVDFVDTLVEEATSRGLQQTQRPAAAEHWRTFAEQFNRTWSTAAYNADAFAALQQAGFTHKRWVTRHDDRVRTTHREVDGWAVGMQAAFIVGGAPMMYPGDPMGPPQETINCRCVLVGVRRE